MAEPDTYCSECGRRVALTTEGLARKHNRGPRNRGLNYPCQGSGRPTESRPALDAARRLRSPGGTPRSLDLGQALTDALELAAARGRQDLIAYAIDEFWLIQRYPADRFPEGPPEEIVDRMRAQREALYPAPA